MGGFNLMKEGLALQQAYLDMTAPKPLFDERGFPWREKAPEKHEHHVLEYRLAESHKALAALQGRTQEEISADLVAQAADNKAKGWSND